MKTEDQFPSSKIFHALLGKPENKIRLQAFLQMEFQRTAATTSTEIIYCVVGSTAKNLTTGKLVPELTCSHAEVATTMLTVYSVLRSDSYTAAVVLDTEDTTCERHMLHRGHYVRAAYVAQKTTGILCVKRKRQLIDARCLCSGAMAASIPFHVLTGCDHNSGFYGASKKLIADRLEKSRGTRPASSMWYTAASHRTGHQWFGAVCHSICLWRYQKQDPGRCEGSEVQSSEEKKHYPTCAWLGQSPSTLGACKLSCIFAKALPAPKSPFTNRPWMASCKWPMSACPFNPAPISPIHTTT